MVSRRSVQRKRVSQAPLSASVQLLEQVSFDLAAEKKSKTEIHYTLTITHRASETKWTQPARSFEQFHQFQQRLLKKLQHGHVCTADCAVLYSFVKSYFPRPVFFGNSSSCLMDKRRENLALCLKKLQQFLLTRDNHGCGILLNDIAAEVENFLLGDVRRQYDHPLRDILITDEVSSRASSSSMLSTTSSEEEEDMIACVCSLCCSSLDGEAFANIVSQCKQAPVRTGSSSSNVSSTSSARGSTCSSLSYTTTLSCGHTFHDECIVPRLNEAMECPTCGHAEGL
ncbi:hypothetical protein FI667_g7776, partial [Globisporangium splendens]